MIGQRERGWETYLDASVLKHFPKLFEKMQNSRVICVYSLICFCASLVYILYKHRSFMVFQSSLSKRKIKSNLASLIFMLFFWCIFLFLHLVSHPDYLTRQCDSSRSVSLIKDGFISDSC